MKLPIDNINVANILALVGLSNVSGIRTRIRENVAESESAPHAEQLAAAAKKRLEQMAGWPDEIDCEWWRECCRRAIEAGDRDLCDTLAAIAGENGYRQEDWDFSLWRMVGGRQRWIRTIQKSLSECSESAIREWLECEQWPRTRYMSMTGIDGAAYIPPALRHDTRVEIASSGHPVSLWLILEGLRLLPVMPSEESARSQGWLNKSIVRFPCEWPDWCSAMSIISAWRSAPMMELDFDDPKYSAGEVGHSPESATLISARRYLYPIRVAEAKRIGEPAPRYWRLRFARFL